MLPVLLTRSMLPQLAQARAAGILNIGSGYDRIGTAEHSIDALTDFGVARLQRRATP
ncbi:MAG: hypothetical protein R3E68_22520 [Burkholderiaceae bacterium]